MKLIKEQIHSKLFSMASILWDNIIIPQEAEQEGYDRIQASYYDDNGNKYTLGLSLRVTPEGADDVCDYDEPSLGLEEQLAIILNEITLMRTQLGLCNHCHPKDDTAEETTEDVTDNVTENTEEQEPTE